MEKGDAECLNGWRTEGVCESEVAGGRKTEICSVRKEERRHDVCRLAPGGVNLAARRRWVL